MTSRPQTIALQGETLMYTIRRHPRAKRTGLTLYPDGSLVVTLTQSALPQTAERFIKKQQEWILRNLTKIQQEDRIFLPKISKAGVEAYKRRARHFVHERLRYWNNHYSFSYNRVAIKNHQKQWGSCSPKKNLNFNFRVLFLPREIADLIIVHELCHLAEMNHSPAFWSLVRQSLPGYQRLEKELKRYVIT